VAHTRGIWVAHPFAAFGEGWEQEFAFQENARYSAAGMPSRLKRFRVRRWYNLCIVGYVVMPEHVHLLLSEPERSSLAVALQMLKQVSSRKLHSRKLHKMGGSPSGNSGGPPFRPLLAKGGKSGPEEQEAQPFWQKRYYDFNVFSDHKRIEKLRYMHRNPVKRGLVGKPEDWKWSSYRHHLTGFEGVVEIESEWTARKREKMATLPKFKHKT
jgi:putative transposase